MFCLPDPQSNIIGPARSAAAGGFFVGCFTPRGFTFVKQYRFKLPNLSGLSARSLQIHTIQRLRSRTGCAAKHIPSEGFSDGLLESPPPKPQSKGLC